MLNRVAIILLRGLTFCQLLGLSLSTLGQGLDYPHAMRSAVQDTLHQVIVEDPYRWLETNDSTTLAWVNAQNKLAWDYQKRTLKTSRIRKQIVENANIQFFPLIKRGQHYYFQMRYGGGNSAQIHRKSPYSDYSTMIFDPNQIKGRNNEVVTVHDFDISLDERYGWFTVSRSGTDELEIRIKDIKRDVLFSEAITGIRFSNVRWAGNGFYYYNHSIGEILYHALRTPHQSDAKVTIAGSSETVTNEFYVSFDETHLVIHTLAQSEDSTAKKMVYARDLTQSDSPFELLMTYPDTVNYAFIDRVNGYYYFKTNAHANNGKIVRFDPSTRELKLVVPEFAPIEKVNIISNNLICLYFNRGAYTIAIFDLEGYLIDKIDFDVGHIVTGLDGDNHDTETIYNVRSAYFPNTLFKIDFEDHSVEPVTETGLSYDFNLFKTKYMQYRSKDGTIVPMYLTYRKDIDLASGENPVLLNGYGGFGVSTLPEFSFGSLAFMQQGGVLATPQIRGGGEFGESWHKDGIHLNKQNSFDDFIAAAEFLIQIKVTNPSRMAINGASNGGLLMGAAMTQRPDLFQAVVAEMGLFDMIRYEQYAFASLKIYENEYGTVEDSLQFQNLLSYSPLHQLKSDKDYPATLVMTAFEDDRVLPVHSYKFVAGLQHYGNPLTPYLLYVQSEAGHYGASTFDDYVRASAIKYAFIMKHLGMDDK